MSKIKNLENKVLEKRFSLLPDEMRNEVLDFIDFLLRRKGRKIMSATESQAITAVKNSWGTILLNDKDARFVAEDKDLEYETY